MQLAHSVCCESDSSETRLTYHANHCTVSLSSWSPGTFCCRSKTGRASTSLLPFQYQGFHQLIVPSTSSVDWLVKSSALLIHGEIFTFDMPSVEAVTQYLNCNTCCGSWPTCRCCMQLLLWLLQEHQTVMDDKWNGLFRAFHSFEEKKPSTYFSLTFHFLVLLWTLYNFCIVS